MADNYTVTGQRETLALDDAGKATRSMEIDATTKPSDVPFTELVPVANYNAENVHAILAQRATAIEAVHAL